MIFIPHNVPSSKNSKRVVRTRTGKVRVIHSKTTMRYIDLTAWDYVAGRKTFHDLIKGMEPPYCVSFKFIRNSRRKFDYVNPLQTVQDLMVKHKWIEDDNSDILLPVFEPYEYSKEKPGVIIDVCKFKSNQIKIG